MKKSTQWTIAVCVVLPIFFSLFSYSPGFRARDIMPTLGIAFAVAALLYIIPGLILAVFKQTRDVGQGVLISVVLLLLVGFTFCSIRPPFGQ